MLKVLNIIKIITVNIIICAILLFVLDYTIYLKFRNSFYSHSSENTLAMYKFPSYIENYIKDFGPPSIQGMKNFDGSFRKANINSSYTKPGILIFGCSFAYNYLIDDDDKIMNYKLSKLTKRNVFNFAIGACGIQHMLYIIQNNFFGILPPPQRK